MDPNAVVDDILAGLMKTWAKDSAAYATLFHPEVRFVDVLARVHNGREAVESIHRKNFATIHAGTTVTMVREGANVLADNVILACARNHLPVPSGPLAGDNEAVATLVIVRDGDEWLVRSFQNTGTRFLAGVPQP
jgi:uncharacterized protein (TIGR02246 family)